MGILYFLTPIPQLSLPVKAIFAAFAILLGVGLSLCSHPHISVTSMIHFHQTISYVIQSYDMLVELFGSITIFMRRVDIYTKIPPTPAMTEIVIKIMAELLSIIALATKQLMQGRLGRSFFDDVLSADCEFATQRKM